MRARRGSGTALMAARSDVPRGDIQAAAGGGIPVRRHRVWEFHRRQRQRLRQAEGRGLGVEGCTRISCHKARRKSRSSTRLRGEADGGRRTEHMERTRDDGNGQNGRSGWIERIAARERLGGRTDNSLGVRDPDQSRWSYSFHTGAKEYVLQSERWFCHSNDNRTVTRALDQIRQAPRRSSFRITCFSLRNRPWKALEAGSDTMSSCLVPGQRRFSAHRLLRCSAASAMSMSQGTTRNWPQSSSDRLGLVHLIAIRPSPFPANPFDRITFPPSPLRS